ITFKSLRNSARLSQTKHWKTFGNLRKQDSQPKGCMNDYERMMSLPTGNSPHHLPDIGAANRFKEVNDGLLTLKNFTNCASTGYSCRDFWNYCVLIFG